MSLRPALQKGLGGVLSVEVVESSVASATVSVFSPSNSATSIVDAVAIVTGSVISFAIPGVVVDALGMYRAQWAYVADGVTLSRNQLFDVAPSVLRPSLTPAALSTRYYGILTGRSHPVGMTHATAIDTAWSMLLDMIVAAGSEPHRILDPQPLEPTHAALAAWVLARNFTPGNNSTQDWQAWAGDRFAEAQTLLASALRSVPYDGNDSGGIDSGETSVNRGRRRLTR